MLEDVETSDQCVNVERVAVPALGLVVVFCSFYNVCML